MLSLGVVRLIWPAYPVGAFTLVCYGIEELIGLAFITHAQFFGSVIFAISRACDTVESVGVEDRSGGWADGDEGVFDTGVGLLAESFIVVALVAHVGVRIVVGVIGGATNQAWVGTIHAHASR